MNCYLFRHAETYFSKYNIPYGDMIESAEILNEGKSTIYALADYLKKISLDANFSSPYIRCRQTVEIVEEVTTKKFKYDERLKDWDSRKESITKMIMRIKDFYEAVANHNYKGVAICTHGYPINALIAMATKGKIKTEDLYNFPKPGVLVIIKNKKIEYLDFN